MSKENKSCQGCPLEGNIKVPYNGNLSAKIIIVGESPGREELKGGQPFIGRAGQLLRHNLALAQIPIEDVYIANSARCLIDKSNLKASEIRSILSHCRAALTDVILSIQPRLILPLGDIAMRQILGLSQITKRRGSIYFSKEFHCASIPLFHPAYVLRGLPSREPIFLEDLRSAHQYAYVRFHEEANRKHS